MSTPLSDYSLLKIALEAFPHEHRVGVLLYGSRAQTCARPGSDIDLIYVIEDTRRYRYVQHIWDMDVDLYAASARFFARTMEKDRKTNDNFLLHAFATGRELNTGNDVLSRLTRKAKSIWQRGPLPASLQEKDCLAWAAKKTCISARRWIPKAGIGPELREMAILECSISFKRMLHGYCRAHGLWALPLDAMLRLQEPYYAEINAFCRAYLAASRLEEKVCVLEEMSKTISRSCDHALWSSDISVVPVRKKVPLDG